MKYLEHTLEIANSLFAGGSSIEQQILSEFRYLESTLEKVQDDIFSPITDAKDSLRRMVGLCYRVQQSGNPESDVAQLRTKNAEYGESWLRRGGRGAFHMLARKADRLEAQVKKWGSLEAAINGDSTESILDTIGDLRRYCLLVLSFLEMKATEERVKPAILEEVGNDIAQKLEFQKKLCGMCGHHRFTHSENHRKCLSTGCECEQYVAKIL